MLVVHPIIYGRALRMVMEDQNLDAPPSVRTYKAFMPRLRRLHAEDHGIESAKFYFPAASTIRSHISWPEAQQLALEFNPATIEAFMASAEIVEHLERRKKLAEQRQREQELLDLARHKPKRERVIPNNQSYEAWIGQETSVRVRALMEAGELPWKPHDPAVKAMAKKIKAELEEAHERTD